MGHYCQAKGFYRKKIGLCGSVVNPEVETSEEVYCENCNSEAKKTLIKQGFATNRSERGTLHITWDIIEVECPKCLIKGTVKENYEEEDVTYHSHEEIRVYRL